MPYTTKYHRQERRMPSQKERPSLLCTEARAQKRERRSALLLFCRFLRAEAELMPIGQPDDRRLAEGI
jgi:hypothetical protein